MVNHTQVFGIYFLKREPCEPVISKRATNNICCNNSSFQLKMIILEKLYLYCELDNFPIIKIFSFIRGDSNNVILLNNELCQHLEDLQNSVNLCFPCDQSVMLQNSFEHQVIAWGVTGWCLEYPLRNSYLSSSGVVSKKTVYNNLTRSY